MTYASNNDLPDAVKNSLPASAQDIFRNAFNSSFGKDNDEEKANKVAWGAVKNAGYAKNDQGNWIKASSELKDIEVFSAGIHEGEKFTESDLDQIVSNFRALKERIKPILKVAHRNKMHNVDGQPSLGWASDLKRVGSKLIASFSDVPELVRKAIDRKLYKRVSSEIYPSLNIGGKNYKRVLSGVGILGADIPVVKDLKDIEVFFADDNQAVNTYSMDVSNGVIIRKDNTMDNEELKKSFEERLKLMEEKYEAQINKLSEDRDEELKKFSEEQAAKVAEKEAEIEALKTANLKRENENKIETFKAFCEAQVSAGKMVPAARDILIKDIDKMEFAEGQEFYISFDKFKEFSEKTAEILDKTEYGIYKPPQKRALENKTSKKVLGGVMEFADLDAAANKIMSERKCSYEEATIMALDENPSLAQRFSEAGFGGEGK